MEVKLKKDVPEMSKDFLFALAPLTGEKRDRASAALLLIIKAEAVSRELQGSANLTGARALRISKPSEV